MMKLNIYIGLRAIAYVIANNDKVVNYGIKRVNISFDDYNEFFAGNPVSKRVNRRLKAQARRNLWRYKSRKNNLLKLVQKEFGCVPDKLSREENLHLRVKGLTEVLSKQDLTNVLFDLQKKRGYKSMRGVSDNDNSDYLKEIERHEANLKKYDSIACYLLTLASSKDIIFTRDSYEDEFLKIMRVQKIDDSLKNKIYNIIYYQRPLKRGKVGQCKYETNRRVMHASNPLYQIFRIWRDVLNIRVYDIEKNEIEISNDLRHSWFDYCNNGKNITKAKCIKDLGLKGSINYSWFSGKLIAGNPINKAFKDIDPRYSLSLWQDIYSATDDSKLSKLLKSKYGLNAAQVNEFLDLDFNKLGWGDFSAKAIKKLVPVMENECIPLSKAILKVYGKVDFENIALRNVVLEQHYFSCRSLYNRLNEEYNIDEVQFEIDHLLKLGNKGRKALAKNKRKDFRFQKEHNGLSQYEKIKIKLWEESGGISPYEPDLIIDKKQLLTDKYNLDHIVPKSKLFERSLVNQVLCSKVLNTRKNRLTGIDFARDLGIEKEYIEVASKFPESKKNFLLMSDDNIPDDYISRRQNSDYNTKCFASIFNGVNIPNKLINRYVSQWISGIYKEEDARCFLQKAWVMANMGQETVNYFDNLKDVSKGVDSVSVYDIKPCVPEIDFDNVLVVMPKIKFSRSGRYGYTPRFALHQESVFGRRILKYRNSKGEIKEELFYKIRQPIGKLSAAMVSRIMDDALRHKVEARILEKGSHDDGMQSLLDDPVEHNGNPIKRVSIRYNSDTIFPIHSTDGKGNTSNYKDFDKKIDFVFNNKNYALGIEKDSKGRIKKSIITLYDFMNSLNSGKRIERGFYLKESDIVELNGVYYYLIGVSLTPSLRPTTTLAAKDNFTIKAKDWDNLKKVEVNQLGMIVGSYGIEDCI